MTASLSGVLSAERHHLRQLSDDTTGERADGNPTMKVLDLFSGIGGFSLGLERTEGFRTVAFCEIEPYCRAVLAKHWPGVSCYDDVRTLTADRLVRDGISVDVICGGFPCQDISVAGKGAGLAGERSGLWFEYARLIGELRPLYVIVENVGALRGRGLDRVLGDLAALGFDAEWHCIPASAVGAPHQRDRIWIVAYACDGGQRQLLQSLGELGCGAEADLGGDGAARAMADPAWLQPGRTEQRPLGERARAGGELGGKTPDPRGHPAERYRPSLGAVGEPDWWLAEPDVGRVAHGVPSRVDRLRALGNAVVPQIPEIIGRAILKAEATQIIGNASPLSLAPDDGPEVATVAPPGHLSAAFCSHSGNGALFLVPPHAPIKQRSA